MFSRVASLDEILPGSTKVIMAGDKEIAIFNLDGNLYAIQHRCPHRGGPLGEGSILNDVVTCPWHGWKFDVKTGISPVKPEPKIMTFPVKIEGGNVFVDIDI